MNVKFSRCTSNNLSNVPISDGQIVFVKDTGEQHIDVGSTRIKITDIALITDLNALKAITNPLSSKLYYVISENMIAYYNSKTSDWQTLAQTKIDLENILTKDNTKPYTPTHEYNPATKKYVDDKVKSEYFTKTFTTSDWVLSGQQYQLSILQSEHLLANPYVVSLEMQQDDEFKSVTMYGSKLLPNGSLLILSDLNYTGRILLKGGI